MARYADADVLLVADIDRGGVFASCYGSIALQTEEDRKRIKGIIVNKFRGDIKLFEDGRKILEDLCKVPVLGVVPMFNDIVIDAEDSVQLEYKHHNALQGKINVAVVLLRHISNFTDFSAMEQDERFNLFYTTNAEDIEDADIVVLPGTKSTANDLYWLRRQGLVNAILRAHRAGKKVIGICGGFQMLGQSVNDPDGIEGSIKSMPGLALLPIDTTLTSDKITQQVEFEFGGHICKGYEIHQGRSTNSQKVVNIGNCWGTYIHGFLDNEVVINFFADGKGDNKSSWTSLEDYKEEQYERLANHIRKHVDIPQIYRIITHK